MLVSLDGKNFAQARYPPHLRLENQAYTILESITNSIFLHVTTNNKKGAEWGDLFKSNFNGTNFALSQELVFFVPLRLTPNTRFLDTSTAMGKASSILRRCWVSKALL